MNTSSYQVRRITRGMNIDGDWNKVAWDRIKPLSILNDNGWEPEFIPKTEVKLRYDETHLCLIFKVEDQFVRCLIKEHNGLVWQDSCVEFFFSPNPAETKNYFNIEVNCCGSILMAFNKMDDNSRKLIEENDIAKVDIAHSISGIIEKEIDIPLTWTIEFQIPFEILLKYSKFKTPNNGDAWKANFYKCAENNSHPHWLSWNEIDHPEPNFHLPEYFGILRFK